MLYTLEQQSAIQHVHGPMMVIAGPGSGKTAVLTQRVVHLIQNEDIKPHELLVMTFTKKAAGEIQSRCKAMKADVEVRTFHSAFYDILQKETRAKLKLLEMESAVSQLQGYVQAWLLCSASEAAWKTEVLLSVYSVYRNTGRRNVREEDLALYQKLIQVYQIMKNDQHLIDFDDMMEILRRHFDDDPSLLNRYQRHYRYLLVDEFQDINGSQFQVLKQLAGQHQNIFVVGDDDQSIYGFRGSEPKYFLEFPKYFPGTRRIDLTKNFRSGSEIVDRASCLIEHNQHRYQKNLHASRKSQGLVRIYEFTNSYSQASAIARKILHMRKISRDQIAILTRVHEQQKILCEQLAAYGISCDCEEGQGISKMEADIRAYIEAANCPDHLEALKRIWNRPRRGLPPLPLKLPQEDDILAYMMKQYTRDPDAAMKMLELKDQLKKIQTLSPGDALDFIWYQVNYQKQARMDQTSSGMYGGDVRRLYQRLYKRAAGCRDWNEFLSAQQNQDDHPAVQIMTMHASKGLEFQAVFLPDVNEGFCPHEKAQSEMEIEEERRLFYVAMTRARDQLYLSYTHEQGLRKKSRFINEILTQM